jgi:hypothetical protein
VARLRVVSDLTIGARLALGRALERVETERRAVAIDLVDAQLRDR